MIRRVKTASDAVFIPDYHLEDIVSIAAIDKILSELWSADNFYKGREVSQLIAEGGRKTFAILVLLGKEKAIFDFVVNDQYQLLDAKLPLEKEKAMSILGDEKDSEDFYRTQWEFLAPILRKDRSHRKFEHCDTILPFLDQRKLDRGGFGDIYTITLHPFQQHLVDLDRNGKVKCIQTSFSSRDLLTQRRPLQS